MDNLAVTIDTTPSSFHSPFRWYLFAEGNSFSFRLEYLVLTPLSWLLHARQKTGVVDFEAWDTALHSALTRMSHHGSSAEASLIELNGAAPAQAFCRYIFRQRLLWYQSMLEERT
jgi:hypothetical protein